MHDERLDLLFDKTQTGEATAPEFIELSIIMGGGIIALNRFEGEPRVSPVVWSVFITGVTELVDAAFKQVFDRSRATGFPVVLEGANTSENLLEIVARAKAGEFLAISYKSDEVPGIAGTCFVASGKAGEELLKISDSVQELMDAADEEDDCGCCCSECTCRPQDCPEDDEVAEDEDYEEADCEHEEIPEGAEGNG